MRSVTRSEPTASGPAYPITDRFHPVTITVSTITDSEHLGFLARLDAASFLQTPAWGKVKGEWRRESIGWFSDGTLVGAGLVLYRQLPKVKRYLAYLPEGPLIDWSAETLSEWLSPMVAHLRGNGAFGVRIGPAVVQRHWTAPTIKAAIADPHVVRLSEVTPDETNATATRTRNELRHLGWRPPREGAGFAAGQPRFNFWLPLAGQSEEELLKGMNQQWRRNIKKAAKAGVEVTRGGADDLPAFHRLYVETAERDGFTPRPLTYFETMYEALSAEDPDRMRIYLARHEEDLVAATTWVRVGTHCWYSYGASTAAKRDVRGSNAIQWQMIRDAREAGAEVYDMRGITEGLASDDPELGLIQFKVGTGGQAVEYLGEWDLPINKAIYAAFDQYLKLRR